MDGLLGIDPFVKIVEEIRVVLFMVTGRHEELDILGS